MIQCQHSKTKPLPWSERGQEVVDVHDDVDEGVEERAEALVAAGHEATGLPGEEGHDAVVDHVQRRHVVVLLAQDEEERVEELSELQTGKTVSMPLKFFVALSFVSSSFPTSRLRLR